MRNIIFSSFSFKFLTALALLALVLTSISVPNVEAKPLYAQAVNNVTVAAQVGTLTYGTAASATFPVTIGCTGSGNALKVTPAVSGLPAGATGSFSPATVTFPLNACPTTLNTTLTITTANSTPAGSFTITATAGAMNGTAILTVDKANTTTTITGDSPDPSLVSQGVTVNYTVASATSGTPTGNVTISDGVDSCTGTVAAGTCSITLTTAGARVLTATYAGDGNFNGSSDTENHTVTLNGTTTTITADTPDPSVVGGSVNVTVTVSGGTTPTGTVDITGANTNCSITLAGGTGNCSVLFTSGGSKTITATYNGDGTHATSTDTEAHTVNAANTSIMITTDSPDPSVVGQSVTVSYSVSVDAPGAGTPTGNVTISDGTTSCTATVAAGACSITFTSAGAKSLTATYAGDANFNGGTSAGEPHTVNAADTTTSITSDTPDPSVVGQSITINYSVVASAPGAGTPTGNVTVSDGTDSCTSTVAAGTCSITFTAAGAKTLTATYAGDANFNGGTSAGEPHTVNAADTTTTITSDTPDPSIVGQSVTVNYSVVVNAPGIGTPTGNVTVSDGTDSCTATVAAGTCSITFTTTGAKTLTATYAGDANFNGSPSAGEPHTVNAPTITLSPASLTNGAIGTAYSQTITASGGTSTYSFGLTAGSLPAGLTLSSGGSLSGTPTQAGIFNFTITATDSSGGTGPYTGSQAYMLTIAAPTISISPATLSNGTLTFAYNQTVTASGGTAPYTYAVTAGSLPNGLSLNGSTGDITGTPTLAGPFNFTITATDSSTGTGAPFSGSRAYSVAISNNTTVTINQAGTQPDPASVSPIVFDVVFSSSVTGFDASDINLSSSTAGGILVANVSGSGATYTVSVSGMTTTGDVIATIPASAALDSVSTLPTAASTSTDNTVRFDPTVPTVTGSTPANSATLAIGLTQLTVTFSEDVKNDGLAGAANNTANYLLVEDGANSAFDTLTCAGGVAVDDAPISITSATYTNNGGSGPFMATLTTSSLSAGSYRLYVCGTTSIQDLNGTELNGGVSDAQINFTVTAPSSGGGGTTGGSTTAAATTALLPATGFPMNQVTKLPVQPVDKAYSSTDMWLEIPKLNVKMSIVGVPSTKGAWDVTWLGKEAGWLNGSAYPTWNGNSVITGHVWDALNRPGPFARLKDLKYGDQIKIHAFGSVYVYEIRSTESISPTGSTKVFKHEEKSWLTLITCEDYKELTNTYLSRRMLKAVLISVSEEKK